MSGFLLPFLSFSAETYLGSVWDNHFVSTRFCGHTRRIDGVVIAIVMRIVLGGKPLAFDDVCLAVIVEVIDSPVE